MHYREYLEKLLWQKLIRDKDFLDCYKTRDPELKSKLEDKYKAFGLKIDFPNEASENEIIAEMRKARGQPYKPSTIHWSIHPSPLTILSESFSSKVIFEIDLDKFKYTSDFGQVIKEIEDKLKFELRLRAEAEAHDTILNYRPEKTFNRDLEILAFWEEQRNRPIKDLSDKFGISEDTAKKALKKIYELIFEKPYHRAKSRLSPKAPVSLPCHNCAPEKKAKCRGCEALQSFLAPVTKKRHWKEKLESELIRTMDGEYKELDL